MLLIASPVAQLLPQLNVKIDFTKIQSWTYQGSLRPSCCRIAWICSGVASSPPRISAGSPPKNLNRKKTNRMTPASVGIICHSLRKIYAATRAAVLSSPRPDTARSAKARIMPSGPLDSNQPATDTLVTIERVSKSRRALSKTLVALPALAGATVHAQDTHATPDRPAAGQKVLRYAFRVAETGFDPAQVNDLYSSTVIANIFDAPLTYDFLARPAKIVPNTAVALPEVSDDFRTLTIRLRPGIFFQDHPAFQGKQARTRRAGLRLFDQAHLRPEAEEPAACTCSRTRNCSA